MQKRENFDFSESQYETLWSCDSTIDFPKDLNQKPVLWKSTKNAKLTLLRDDLSSNMVFWMQMLLQKNWFLNNFST